MTKTALVHTLNFIEGQRQLALERPDEFFERTGVERGGAPQAAIARHFNRVRVAALAKASAMIVSEIVDDELATDEEAGFASAERAKSAPANQNGTAA